jgi:hypothetical protein
MAAEEDALFAVGAKAEAALRAERTRAADVFMVGMGEKTDFVKRRR